MKKIIALDFDGVLHPRSPSSSLYMLKGVGILSEAIEGLTDVSIVIDSTWRRYPSDLNWAIARFPLNVSSAIVGCTPILGGKEARESEIEAWIKVHVNTSFKLLILDDEPQLFSGKMMENVYSVNGDLGLCTTDMQRVRERLIDL
jgi:hypothetical protein